MFSQLIICIAFSVCCLGQQFTCPTPSGTFKNPSDVHKYYICADGLAYSQTCPGVLVFDDSVKTCVKDSSGTTPAPATTSAPVTTAATTAAPVTTSAPPATTPPATAASTAGTTREHTSSAPVTTDIPANVSCDGCKDNCYLPDPSNRHYFFECDHNRLVARVLCQSPLVFDAAVKACIFDRDHKDPLCPTPDGIFKHPSDPHKFILCADGFPHELTCPSNLVFNGVACDNA